MGGGGSIRVDGKEGGGEDDGWSLLEHGRTSFWVFEWLLLYLL